MKPLQMTLFTPRMSRYNVLHRFTDKLCEALLRKQQKAKTLTLNKDKPALFFEELIDSSPDCSLTFNPISPDSNGIFLWDILKIPHVSWLVDSPNIFFATVNGSKEALLKTRYGIFTSVDRDSCKIFHDIGLKNVFFLPHGVERELSGKVEDERPYEAAMLASPIDYEWIEKGWKTEFHDSADAISEAAKLALENPDISYFRAYATIQKLADDNGKISDEIVKHALPLCALEKYVRGFDRVNLVKCINHAHVHVYGGAEEGNGWNYFLRDKSNVTVHNPLLFQETFELMKKTKIVLNSCSWIRDGGHERIFSAMACGALVITTRTPYLEENFVEGEEILFYDLNDWNKVDDLVEYYLKHDDERIQIALRGQQKVHRFHTWDNRADVLIEKLPSLLEEMKRGQV